jgi:hypothetical protein
MASACLNPFGVFSRGDAPRATEYAAGRETRGRRRRDPQRRSSGIEANKKATAIAEDKRAGGFVLLRAVGPIPLLRLLEVDGNLFFAD